jgi:hypothetical protein
MNHAMKNLVVYPPIEAKLKSIHKVGLDEVRQCFLNRDGRLLIDSREKNKTNPPTLWFIAETNKKRALKIVYILIDGVVYLKTAYEPSEEETRIYRKFAID